MDTRINAQRERIERVREALDAARLRMRCWCRRATRTCPNTCPSAGRAAQWLSGFTGSMGTLVVTLDARRAVRRQPLLGAGRGRARRQRHRAGEDRHRHRARTTSTGWPRTSPAAQTVAVDGSVLGLAAAQPAARRARRAPASRCAPTSTCSPRVWPDRPALPHAPVYEHAAPQAPLAARRQAGAGCARRWPGTARRTTSSRPSTTSPGSLNLRGADVGYNPVFLAHLLIDARARDAVRRRRQGRCARCARALAADGVHARADYAQAAAALRGAAAPARAADRPAPRHARPARARARRRAAWSRRSTRARLPRAARATAEAAHVREAMAQDGAAMCEFYAWFEAALAAQRAHHRADDRREADAPRAPSGPASSARASAPSPASTPTARCRTTAPRPNRTR